MQERHQNRKQYFSEQGRTTQKYVIPFIEHVLPVNKDISVLEVGCGEAGNLVPFLDLGCKCVGVDIACGKVKLGNETLKDHQYRERITLLCEDIFKWETKEKFDLIFLRDVLEHLPTRDLFLEKARSLLKPGGKMFLGFPPWQNPFGGHQQMCENKTLGKMPFIHLLPKSLYVALLKRGGETPSKIEGLIEVRDTRISIGQFRKLVQRSGFKIDRATLFFINPNYETKFGLKPRKQILSFIPVLRNFIVTTCYYIISPK